MSERTALLADFGGVLTTNVHDAFRVFSSQIGDDPELVLRLLSRDPGSSRLLAGNECGRLDDESFEHGFAARLAAHGVRVSPRLAEADALRFQRRSRDARRARRAAGRRMPVALVTNSFGRDCYDGFDLHALADVVVISSDVGVRKPSRRIYAIACERLGVAPASCVTVDDIEHNLEGAARLGIAGVLHTSAERTVRELDDRFGIRAAA